MYLSNKNKFNIYYLYYKDKKTNKIKKITTKSRLKKEALEFVSNFKPDETENVKEVLNFSFNELQDKILQYTSQNFTFSTNQIYKYTTNNFLKIIGNKSLSSITIDDIEFFKIERLKKVNKVTVNIDIRTLKAVFRLAVRWRMIKDNPCQYVHQFIVNEKEKLSFENYELEKVLAIIENNTLKNIVLFASYTGCRISEILNIQWSDIDFVQRIITIRNKPNFKTKTGKIRQIPMSDKLFTVIDKLNKGNNGNKNMIYDYHNPDDYLFTNNIGIKYEYTYITMLFKKYLRMAGIDEKYHFHCLRHTFITNLIKKGVNINFVKEIAGHSDIGTTMNYIHIVTEDLRDAVNML
jgi:integrase